MMQWRHVNTGKQATEVVNLHSICSRCQRRLGPRAIRTSGKQYHPECFVCDACKQPLEASFYPKGNALYHQHCYEARFVPKCKHCGQAIQGEYNKDAQGRYHKACYLQLHQLFCNLCQQELQGRYLYDHWGNKAHPEHQGQPTGQCHVCARLERSDQPSGRRLSDGRLLCQGCHQSEVQHFQQVQQAKLEVISQMQAVGFDYIPDYIKVEFSEDQQLLNQRMQASPTGNIHGFTRTQQRHIPGYGLILEHSISVLSGLPKVAFMGVLAHELLHVWIHENNLRHLSHAEVEGFCNLGSALICHNDASELAQVLLQRMAEDPDLAYGEGYRAMAWRLQQMGWPALLAALRDPSQPLPEVPAEVLPPQTRSQTAPTGPASPTPPPQAPAVSPVSSESAERLKALREKFSQAAQQRPAAPATEQRPAATNTATDSEALAKVRERFARKPASQPAPPKGGNKLGSLKKKKK